MQKVHTIDFNNQDKILASGSEDWNIKLWNLDNFSCILTLFGHKDAICSL